MKVWIVFRNGSFNDGDGIVGVYSTQALAEKGSEDYRVSMPHGGAIEEFEVEDE